MADIKKLEEKGTRVSWLDPRILKVKEGLNVRGVSDPEVVAHIEWLSESIAVEGVRKPLEVFSEGADVFVADGHCRLAATMMAIAAGADIRSVPCIVEPRGVNDVVRKLNQIVSNSGKPLSVLEAGAAIAYAIAKGWSREDVAKKLGRSLSYVAQALEFQAADSGIHAHVRAGEISATTAAAVVREVGAVAAPAVVREAVESAKAAGKKKATASTIKPLVARKAVPDNPQVVCLRAENVRVEKPSSLSQEMNVSICGVVYNAPKAVWAQIADQILDIIEGKAA